MSLAALSFVLVAAVLHAGWNLLVKQAERRQIFLWWALCVGNLCFLFVLFLYPSLPMRILPYVLVSACLEAVYFLALAWAYDLDDFSLVYPIARGSAPALLFLWSALFLHETIHLTGLLGIALLVFGLVLIGSGPLLSHTGKVSWKGVGAALLAALCISLYSAVDGAAVRLVPSAPYTILVLLLTSLLVTPAILLRYGLPNVANEWRTSWRQIVFAGIGMILTYILVLQAYTLGRVSYAGTIREGSVVVAAFIGWRWLGEGFGRLRLVGAALIFLGILVIAILG